MKITLLNSTQKEWKVEKIGVVGPGIVGMPMAALLADARIKIGTDKPAKVCIVQRNSKNSGWKVEAINQGKSVIGGIEPELNNIVEKNVKEGILSASWDFNSLSDADVILIAIQTDKDGFAPDYGPLLSGISSLAEALQKKPSGKVPLIIFESTLAPSSMATVIKNHFAKFNLQEGKDILLGNSPNRVMPGRLIERITDSDKIAAGLHPNTPQMILYLYKHIARMGTIHITNSLTAEIVKTLENAYRDARIAFTSEIVRYCDEHNIDFYKVRDEVNAHLLQYDNASYNPNAVPSGGILVPTVGVGGHCLPKDGILLWWRKIENHADTTDSLILRARNINDESPAETIKLFERSFGKVNEKKITILGAAYRFNSEDTRNSPTLQLALQLLQKGSIVTIHDHYVKYTDQNLTKYKLNDIFTRDLDKAIKDADYIIVGTAHRLYFEELNLILSKAKMLKGILDACNVYHADYFKSSTVRYAGIGRGIKDPNPDFIRFVYNSFGVFDTGFANEINDLCSFFNEHYADGNFNTVQFSEIQKLAASCSTGCEIANTGKIANIPTYKGFSLRLARHAFNAAQHQSSTVLL